MPSGRHLSQSAVFPRQEIEADVYIGGELAEPAGELVGEEAGSDGGGVERAFGGAWAGLSVGLGEERRGVVSATRFVGGGEESQNFAAHAAIGPETSLRAERSPDRRSGGDAVDRTEDRVPHRQPRPIAVGDHGDRQRRLNFEQRVAEGLDLEAAEITMTVALRGEVRSINGVEVDQRQPRRTERGELQCEVSADRADAITVRSSSVSRDRGTRSACRAKRSVGGGVVVIVEVISWVIESGLHDMGKGRGN